MRATDTTAVVSTDRLAAIRDRLNLVTVNLTRQERQEVSRLAYRLWTRLTCEEAMDKLGWEIPAYGTPEWQELFEAWVGGV